MLMEEYNDEDDTFDLSNIPPYYAQKLNGFLKEASKQGHLTCVEILVSKGADVNYIDKRDRTTVLQTAIFNGHNKITEYLYNKSNEKTRQAAHAYARDNLKKMEDALKIFKDPANDSDKSSGSSKAETQTTEVEKVTEDVKANTEVDTVSKEYDEKKTADEGAKTTKPLVDEKQHLNNQNAINVQPELFLELEANHLDLKKDYNHLHREYNALEADYDELTKKYDAYKKETDEVIFQLKHQVERLNNELAMEKEHNEETEDVLDNLGKELSDKMREIASVKIERDTERRAKEIAKKILDNAGASSNGLLLNTPESPKSENLRNRIDLSFTSNTLVPNKVKQEGSKDDIEIHIEDRVKYRVRRLVKRWEERTFSADV